MKTNAEKAGNKKANRYYFVKKSCFFRRKKKQRILVFQTGTAVLSQFATLLMLAQDLLIAVKIKN
jgi:hypothetical protein